MSASTWYRVAMVGFILAGIFGISSIIIFFRLHIRSVLAELSGKGVAKEVELLRRSAGVDNQRENSVRKSGKLKKKQEKHGETNKTVLLNSVEMPSTATTLLTENQQTASNATTLLMENQIETPSPVVTDELKPSAAVGDTEQLQREANEAVAFAVVRNDVAIHTEEEI